MLDKIPFLHLTQPSHISLTGEFAQLIAGQTKGTQDNASYLDDFENSKSAIDVSLPSSWFISSVPSMFPEHKEKSSTSTSLLEEEAARRRHDLSERATKKVFRRLMPFLLLMYVIAFLDRSNVSFAQQEFEVDFGISAAAYAFGAGLFFIGYAVFEVPSNVLLHRVGARWWLARIMVSWGIVAACFVFVQGPISFYVLRFLLGVTEAGFFPGVILYLTYWIPARHLSRARGYFYM